MSMRDVDLQSTLARIASSSATERKDGLADIENLFRYNNNSHVTNTFKDKTWHSIYNALFNCAAAERSAYLRATQSQKSRASTRLAACGKALRITVTAGVKRIRAKTVKAVVDHILQALPTAEGPCYPGLALDYVKSLRVILEYQPHVEHFRDLWQDVLDLCLSGVAPFQNSNDSDGDEAETTAGVSLRTTTISLSRRSRAATPQPLRSQRIPVFRKEADDLVACIYQLVRATNAPIAGNELNVVDSLQTFLQLSDSVRLSYNDAFAAINSILSRTAITMLEPTRSMVLTLLPLIKDLWSSKSSSLKEEMLITLVLTKDHVSALVEDPSQATFRIDLENLLEALQMDYSKRLERDQLQLGDIFLSCPASQSGNSNLQLPVFALQRGRLRAESLWTILRLAAGYTAALDNGKLAMHNSAPTNGNGDGVAIKRPRITLLYQDIVRQASSSPIPAARIANLQYLCFLFQLTPFTEAQVEEVLTSLSSPLADQNPHVARWTILAFASCAFQKSAHTTALHEQWLGIFLLASRLLTAEKCSRAASFLLYVLLDLKILSYGEIASIAETILGSIEVQGPTLVSESSLALLGLLMNARATENPNSTTTTAERLVQWIFQKWTPSTFLQKELAANIAGNCRPLDLVEFLSKCLGQVVRLRGPSFDLCGQVAQAWNKMQKDVDLSDFLLLRPKGQFLAVPAPANALQADKSGRSSLSTSVRIIDALEAETSRVLANWADITTDKPQALLPDMFKTVTGLIVVNAALIGQTDGRAKNRVAALRKKAESLVKAFTNFLSRPDCELENLDAALNTLADYLPAFEQPNDEADYANNDLVSLSVHLATALERRRQEAKSATVVNQDDMELDDGFESQHSEVTAMAESNSGIRDLVGVTTDLVSFRQCIAAHVQLITAVLHTSIEPGDTAPSVSTIPSLFITYMAGLSPQEFLACRPVFLDVLASGVPLSTNDAETLFDHLASFLEAYEYSRHEVALLLHVDLLHQSASKWVSGDNETLTETAAQAYEWFVETALPNGICSSVVKVGIARLFSELLRTKGPTYQPILTVPSVQTCLFQLLQTGDVAVVHCVVRGLAEMFNQFTLEKHEEIFNDLHQSSLFSETWLEGNALRMLLFSSLGSRWHTLLRRCIYHIFETAGAIPRTSPYAARCVLNMTEHLGLTEPQALFRLFAGQMLYTWIRQSEGSWKNIPFTVFGFGSLRSLLVDVREEVYAQLLMRNDKDELVETSAMIGFGQAELATYSFPRAAAYSFAWDSEMKSKRVAEKDRSETRLRGLIGSQYPEELRAHYPKILGIFLLRTNFEKKQETKDDPKKGKSEENEKDVVDVILEKGFSNDKAAKRDNSFEINALQAFNAIKAISSSNMRLPDPQQPMFRPKVFLDVLNRLSRRIKVSLPELFQPAVYVFVLRLLLSNLHEALGSLHACLIVRKIRLLIALSGDSALSGYPLETTLHSLRPLLTDRQCAEDVLGIVQYLYSNGIEYLKQEISFVAGMNVTVLTSLRKFVGSSQESTTLESQHLATVNKANTFRKWLVEYWSRKFAEGMTEMSPVQAYLRMISYAYGAGTKSNATAGSAESNLLWQILDDRRSRRGLLQGATWNLALKLLCAEFEDPPSYRFDILGPDSQARKYTAEVWASCKENEINVRYLQWAARVLGRASKDPDFDSSVLLQDQVMSLSQAESGENEETSQRIIINFIADLLFSGDRMHAGLAEETLRSILVRSVTIPETLAELQEHLSDAIVQGLYLIGGDTVVPVALPNAVTLETCFTPENIQDYNQWICQLTSALVASSAAAPVVGSLGRILAGVSGIAESLFPPVLHLVLKQDIAGTGVVHHTLSLMYSQWLSSPPPLSTPHVRALLHSILYLRKQPYPQEVTHADRLKWLDIDFTLATVAAEQCGMHTAALLFAELTSFAQPTRNSSRSTVKAVPTVSEDTMLSIYRNIDDPDSFYGVPQPPSLDLVLSRFDHEAEGFKALMFRGAKLDSQMRRVHELSAEDNGGLIKSLVGMNMNTLTYNLLSGRNVSSTGPSMVDSVLQTAMRLEQWDVRAPETATSDTATLYKVFQAVHNSMDVASVREELEAAFLHMMQSILAPSVIERTFKSSLCALGILTEIDDMITSTAPEQLRDAWINMHARESGLFSASLNDVKSVLSSREILLSTICSNAPLREAMHINLRDARILQIDILLSSCRVWKRRQDSEQSLGTVTYLSDLVPICAEIGINIGSAAQNAVADVLWTQGEYSTAVRILQQIVDRPQPKNELEDVQRPSLLAKLGHHVAKARLEPAGQIMNNYLVSAISALKGQTMGTVAGQVFHQFAAFCDEQLQNQENIDDLDRATKIRNRRKLEIEAMTAELKAIRSQTERSNRKSDLNRAHRWYKLDTLELDRLRKVRENFMEQCLENYLLSLTASDEHDNDVLRFYAIWLENAGSDLANITVQKYLGKIASAKFARLMNQLSSRMQADNTLFQKLLCDLVFRICREHPFHGMHHITAGTHDPGTDEEASRSRHNAAKHIATRLKNDKYVGNLWHCVFRSDRLYHDVARYTDEEVQKQGREFRLDQFGPSRRLQESIGQLQTPPPTLSIPLRADMDYKSVPRVIGFSRSMRVAGGLSAPKIITSKLSDGSSFKQLFKGGNDDLRQDAIMEQVFAEVSKLLGNHTSTRQRKLQIRTYNVLPLSNRSGVIEFAQNTKALQDVLVPLHEAYHPKDLKSSICRQKISDAARDTTEARIKAYRDVCRQFQPAMRYFFFERFPDSDVWFERRLAYTRSTAAMSILGYVIGLGDRHLHNILLDYVTGEVVHIDLGVCFEAGRVLPIPEVIPFRLTRDLVDGMGYTRTEGVYRRCCEFTLEALREERESIMTLLNVLRYDPLYSWTVSATKAKRLQEADDVPNRAVDEANLIDQTSRKKDDEMGEAGRALSVVEKKLSKTLSKEATVSELIAQATDERNLALLFAGWSAWV